MTTTEYEAKRRSDTAQRCREARTAWLSGRCCVRCGKPGPDGLHIFDTGRNAGSVFTCRPEVRDARLAGAVVICTACGLTDPKYKGRTQAQVKIAGGAVARGRTVGEGGLPPSVLSVPIVQSRAARRAWREERRSAIGYGRGKVDA